VHVPVLAAEVLAAARSGSHRVVLDGTVGPGGHAGILLDSLPGIEVYVGIDRDRQALAQAERRLERHARRLRLHHATFDRAGEVLDAAGIGDVDLALLDLGVSSLQLDDPARGFSLANAGPIDMRMDAGDRETALDLIRNLDRRELARVLVRYGEVDCPGRIARALKENEESLATTLDLARIATAALPAALRRRRDRIHPATRTFQALRIAVNRELRLLEEALPRLVARLAVGGRLAVISFHSLEDRIAKRALAAEERGCICPPGFPVCACGRRPRLIRAGGVVTPGGAEVAANPRSRSAKLRIGVRV
jgi:16S rRNA (cytosine1402-N4)-methyltransferase